LLKALILSLGELKGIEGGEEPELKLLKIIDLILSRKFDHGNTCYLNGFPADRMRKALAFTSNFTIFCTLKQGKSDKTGTFGSF
jgi:hypothetical protein